MKYREICPFWGDLPGVASGIWAVIGNIRKNPTHYEVSLHWPRQRSLSHNIRGVINGTSNIEIAHVSSGYGNRMDQGDEGREHWDRQLESGLSLG